MKITEKQYVRAMLIVDLICSGMTDHEACEWGMAYSEIKGFISLYSWEVLK